MSSPLAESLKVEKLYDVKDWVTVVTGGGTGLGIVTASALAANGAVVYITGRRLEVLEKAAKEHSPEGRIIPVQGNVTSKEDIKKLVAEISSKHKHVNLLINNSGVSLPHPDHNKVDQTPEVIAKHLFEDESFENWRTAYEINTASYYFVTAAFIPLLVAAKSSRTGTPGNVINISSMSGITKSSQKGQFSYNASKAATISLTEQLAYEFKRPELNIRVNTLAPGYFPSQMTPISPNDGEAAHFREKWGIPCGRPGSPEDYAQLLLSVAVNGYVNGATFLIDGGWLLATP